jgi:glycosyltransferase involved in cell wall biosynthesis
LHRKYRQVRVLIWQWGRFGVGARYAYELAQTLKDVCGYQTLLSLAEGAELMQNETVRRAVDIPVRTYSNAFEFVWRSPMIGRLLGPMCEALDADPPDVAIVTMMGYWDIPLVRRLRRRGVPVVVVVHDAEVHPGDRFHVMVRLQRELMRMSNGVITLTQFVARQVASRVSLDGKVQAVIPLPAFDFADADLPAPHLPDPSPGRPLRLLMAGRLKRYKGLKVLADSLKLIGNTPLNLRVVGAVQGESEIRELVTLPSVELDLGWKTDRELIAQLDWADVTVLPYVEASQSGIAPTSLARARPVIATPVGGLPEQISHGQTGIVVESVSSQAFASAIKRYADDRAFLRRCGENALRFAQTELGWPKLGPYYAKVLEQVVTTANLKARAVQRQ